MPRPWFERRFDFAALDARDLPLLVERVRGTPARLEEKLRGLPAETLRRRDGERWSIQEHAGHLLDLDALHLGRLDDYRAGASVLRAADLQNRRTHEAGHNQRDLAALLAAFREERGRFVERLAAWDPERLTATALHPRLQLPMRVVDMAFFVAEHDDHHLARMTELARGQSMTT
jgi:uncharacterized damage-inducible protein DinB